MAPGQPRLPRQQPAPRVPRGFGPAAHTDGRRFSRFIPRTERESSRSDARRSSEQGTSSCPGSHARSVYPDACLRLGANEEASGGRARDAALEDAFEALVGAVNLDGGLEAARAVVLRVYGDLAVRLGSLESHANPKGRLQEIVQPIHGNQAIRYEVLGTEGAAHEREYEVAVFLLERRIGSGRGTSKKLAEEEAARSALATLDADPASR